MQLVIDANIVISMLIKPGKPIDLFFREEIELRAPGLLFEELQNNLSMILDRSHLSESEVIQFLGILKSKITIIPEEEFNNYRETAQRICPDKKDVPFFALALYLHCPIWTNEKELKSQPIVQIFGTGDLLRLFEP